MIGTSLIIAISFLIIISSIQDTTKGVAALWGSKKTTFKHARLWGVLNTGIGSLGSLWLSQTLIEHFQLPHLTLSPIVLISLITATTVTIVAATIKGYPIATTHALIGAILGSSFISIKAQFPLHTLLSIFVLPLILSPILAILLSWGLYYLWRHYAPKSWKRIKKITKPAQTWHEKSLIGVHFLVTAFICINRGLNDTPKFIGLLLILPHTTLSIPQALFFVMLMMIIGGLMGSKPTAHTLAKSITNLKPYKSLIASFSTGLILTLANCAAMPVSMTHILTGGLYGVGLGRKKTNHKTMATLLFAWLLTVPISFGLSIGFYLLLTSIT